MMSGLNKPIYQIWIPFSRLFPSFPITQLEKKALFGRTQKNIELKVICNDTVKQYKKNKCLYFYQNILEFNTIWAVGVGVLLTLPSNIFTNISICQAIN
jgi:hypothetical protein